MVRYLIGRIADPVFGVATGIAAYAMWERDPRNAHDHGPGNRLWDLVQRRFQGAEASAAPAVSHAAAPAAPAAVPQTTAAASLKDETHMFQPVPPANQLPHRLI
ncbi:hypothetical protein MBRA1_000673 [Malassezia brasiliensis]|uniref:Uncharacterized protein n=1 Tax=Malassezia brasiliensis TaxID=1821822 RepID=A0AAF0DTX6_9BASI|nr:hypothetical protein MBRA1_000673 [Malassezia brasiliensis]